MKRVAIVVGCVVVGVAAFAAPSAIMVWYFDSLTK